MKRGTLYDLGDRIFWLASEKEIKEAQTTDVYFLYTKRLLEAKGLKARVVMEVYVRKLPYEGNWGVVSGIYEVAKLLEGLPVNVKAVEEGDIFPVQPSSAVYAPLLQIEGRYVDFAEYENALLGLLCYSTGVSTKAARIRLKGWGKVLFSFGTRRTHPALAPLVERAAYIAGFDGVSNVLGARLLGVSPVGTMPHSLILTVGDARLAWKWFDEVVDQKVPRVALVDTFYDEKAEALMALEELGPRLYGVRLDTPSSRRGDWRKIIEEVRWELNLRGARDVKLFVSGGLDEEDVERLKDLVDGFGVGTSVSAAPVVDFSAKVVEVERDGKMVPRAKRGDIGGRKQLYRLEDGATYVVAPAGLPVKGEPLLKDLIVGGKLVRRLLSPQEIRERVLASLDRIRKGAEPRLVWQA
jgi:nicotinate phosphoribosyltransferase